MKPDGKTVADRGYFTAGSIERIEYQDGAVAVNPVYAKIDTELERSGAFMVLVEALWVNEDGSVHARRVPIDKIRVFPRKGEAAPVQDGKEREIACT